MTSSYAGMADRADSKSADESRVGSSPTRSTYSKKIGRPIWTPFNIGTLCSEAL